MKKETQKKSLWEVLEQIVNIGFYIGFILIMIVCISEKTNLHCDEVYTYVMTNNTFSDTITVAPDWYYIYENPEDVWLRAMTVQEGKAFNFTNVWEKQAADNHPPFYYSLVHIICSFFPTMYSKWFAGTVNIVLGILLLFTARKIVNILSPSTQTQFSRFFVSCCLIFSAGLLSALTFFRMYVATMFFVTLTGYIFLKGTETRNYKFYLSLFTASVLGALTHYYFVVYLLFICLVFGVILVLHKRWRDFGLFVGTMAMAACTAIAIFPAMLKHVFGTTLRGQQTMNQLTEFSWTALKANLQSAYAIVDSQLFGGMFLLLMAISMLTTLIALIIAKKKSAPVNPVCIADKKALEKWLLLWIPVIGYFIAISKIAVYTTDRYFHPIYALLIILVVTTLCQAIGKLFQPKFAFILLLPILLFSTFKEFGDNWFYLYRGTQTLLDNAAAHSDKDCIFFCDNLFEVDPAFYEVSNYDRVAFVPYAVPERIGELQLRTENGLIVTVTNACDFNVVVQKLQEVWPSLDTYQMLGSHSFSTTYYFY